MLSFPLQRKPQCVARIRCAFELLQTWVGGFENQSLPLVCPSAAQSLQICLVPIQVGSEGICMVF